MDDDKRIARIRRQVHDVAPEELRDALFSAGFTLDGIHGSHWIYHHDRLPRNLSIPYRRPLRAAYVRMALKAIAEVRDDEPDVP